MQIVKQKKTHSVDAAENVTIYEYLMTNTAISGSTATINGRYPKNGFAKNTISKEIALVLSGNGVIGIHEKETSIEIGDCIFIDENEKFYWHGTMTLFIVCAPAFKSAQHITSL